MSLGRWLFVGKWLVKSLMWKHHKNWCNRSNPGLCTFDKMGWLYLWLWQFRFASLGLLHFMKPRTCLLMPMYAFSPWRSPDAFLIRDRQTCYPLPSDGPLLEYRNPSNDIMWNLWSLFEAEVSVSANTELCRGGCDRIFWSWTLCLLAVFCIKYPVILLMFFCLKLR